MYETVCGEHGILETIQIVLWISATIIAGVLAIRRRSTRERLYIGWFALLASLATFREFDGHIMLNPEVLGEWGVRYRIDWWISANAPVLPRVVWALTAAILAFAIAFPILKTKPKTITLVRGHDHAYVLLILSVAGLGAGYALDDLLGRDQFVPSMWTQSAEEFFEFFGAAMYVLAMVAFARRPLGAREATATERMQSRHETDQALTHA